VKYKTEACTFTPSPPANQSLRFLIIKKPNGYGTALDACRICGAEGYRQDGQNVVCRHCGSAIYVPSVGDQGGCNPIGVPIAHRWRRSRDGCFRPCCGHEGDSSIGSGARRLGTGTAPRSEKFFSVSGQFFSAGEQKTRNSQQNPSLRNEYQHGKQKDFRAIMFLRLVADPWTPSAPQAPDRGGAGSRHGCSHRRAECGARCRRPLGERIPELGRESPREPQADSYHSRLAAWITAPSTRALICRIRPRQAQDHFLAQQYRGICPVLDFQRGVYLPGGDRSRDNGRTVHTHHRYMGPPRSFQLPDGATFVSELKRQILVAHSRVLGFRRKARLRCRSTLARALAFLLET